MTMSIYVLKQPEMWINGLDVKYTPLSLEFTKSLCATGCCVYINISHRQ